MYEESTRLGYGPRTGSRRYGEHSWLSALLALTGAALFAVSTAGIAVWIQEIPMPSLSISNPQLVGVSLAAAQERLTGRNIELQVLGERLSDRYPRGAIIQQSLVGGWLKSGKRVLQVTLSAGLVAPDLVGLTRTKAEITATRLGWTVVSGPATAEAHVRLQHPAPGAMVDTAGELSVAFGE
jgi:beta-lactam-binding protein with PASTA domain